MNIAFESNKKTVKRLNERLKLLKKQIKEVEKEIHSAVQTDEVLKEKIDRICQVKGLGLITLATVIAETNGFVLFTSRGQLVSYAGYDVVEKESGTSVKGNSHIRRVLYFPAITVVKHEPQFKQLFERVQERTRIGMKGYVAVQRKLLILIYTLFKNDSYYDPKYFQKKLAQKIENQVIQNCRQETSSVYAG